MIEKTKYKKQNVHGMIDAQKAARVQKYRQLFAWNRLFRREVIFTADDPQPTDQLGLFGMRLKKSKLLLLFKEAGVKINQDYMEHCVYLSLKRSYFFESVLHTVNDNTPTVKQAHNRWDRSPDRARLKPSRKTYWLSSSRKPKKPQYSLKIKIALLTGSFSP
jgi:hypothetical protein